MLGKCIKHEWKAVWKNMTLLNGALLLMGVIGALGIAISMKGLHIPVFLEILYGLAYVILLTASAFISHLLLLSRFYKSLFTDEGYLTHSLPVSAHAKLISRVLIFAAWGLLNLLAIASSLLLLLTPFWKGIASAGLDPSLWVDFLRLAALSCGFPGIGTWLAGCALLLLASMFYTILSYFGCVSLGSLFSSHRILAAVLIYLGLNMLLQNVGGFLLIHNPFGISLSAESTERYVYVGSISMKYTAMENFPILMLLILLGMLLAGAAFYFVSHYVLEKRLNLP